MTLIIEKQRFTPSGFLLWKFYLRQTEATTDSRQWRWWNSSYHFHLQKTTHDLIPIFTVRNAARTSFAHRLKWGSGFESLSSKLLLKPTHCSQYKKQNIDLNCTLYSESEWQQPEEEKQRGTAALRGTPSSTRINISALPLHNAICITSFKSQKAAKSCWSVWQGKGDTELASCNPPAWGGLLTTKREKGQRTAWAKPEFQHCHFTFCGIWKKTNGCSCF